MATANDLITRAFRLLGIVDASTPTTDSVAAQTLITQALKLLGVIEATETPQADDLADGLAHLNAMIKNWPGSVSFADLVTPVTTPKLYLRAIPYNLALEIAPAYTIMPSELVVKVASESFIDVQRRAVRDDALTTLNAMLQDWPTRRVFANGTADLALPEGWERAIPYNLAVELSAQLGMAPPPQVIALARETVANVKRRAYVPQEATFDPAIGTTGAGFDIYAGE